jgi:molybdopterin molybdotransferase
MISVDEALDHVRRCVRQLPARTVPLSEAAGLRLAEDVISRDDSPPFDKSMVDGFAIAVGDPSPTLRVAEVVYAGAVPTKRVERGATVRLMTGAPLPAGADAVVKWEDCDLISDSELRNPATTFAKPPRAGDCIVGRGSSFRAGERLLAPGKRLGPLDVALLAEIGWARVAVVPRPRVGVLPTGDELVDPAATPGPGQIRNSNGPMLLAAAAEASAEIVDLGVARDDLADLRAKVTRGLECDVLLVSGGVSAGAKDLVPGVLAELGVTEVFHQVRLKPGKPLWFGVAEREGRSVLVFGLPGNPVSTFVGYKLFVEPAIEAAAGGEFTPASTSRARLARDFTHRGGRPTYHPCRRVGAEEVEPLAWRGSADLAALTRADCLGVFPAGDYRLDRGAEIETITLARIY